MVREYMFAGEVVHLETLLQAVYILAVTAPNEDIAQEAMYQELRQEMDNEERIISIWLVSQT